MQVEFGVEMVTQQIMRCASCSVGVSRGYISMGVGPKFIWARVGSFCWVHLNVIQLYHGDYSSQCCWVCCASVSHGSSGEEQEENSNRYESSRNGL